jgi:rRNA maturation endonuclease Nob1
MSNHTEPRQAETGEAPNRSGVQSRALTLDVIACDGCGRRFTTDDGPGMIASIKGPCPDCGGRFQLVSATPEDRLL